MNVAVSVRDLFAHMEWADALVWRTLVASPVATADRRCFDLLLHYSITQRAFFDLWRDIDFDPHSLVATAPKDLNVLAAFVRDYYGNLFTWLDSVEETRAQEPLAVSWVALIAERLGRRPAPSTVGETMMQVAMHSAHHRGQLNARLRELGCEPQVVDFIMWVWLGKPAAEWPTVSGA